MVKQFFKPEIYHELYEVDVYSNGNKNNSVYQYYRNMIPANMQYPQPTPTPPEQPLRPNDLMQPQVTPPPAPKKPQNDPNQVIEIDDDAEAQA